MDITSSIPSIQELKTRAKRIRIRLKASGVTINHSASLESVAHDLGYRDWNTLHAKSNILQAGCPYSLGGTVSGTYLSTRFTGKVMSLSWLHQLNQTRMTIRFDEPIDVVSFDSFSAYRHQVNCTLNMNYQSNEVTCNGQPIVRLNY